METRKKKFKLPLSVYLSYLLFASFLFSFVTFSSYVTGTTNSSTTRVAKFEIVVDSQAKELKIDANKDDFTDQFDFSVKSNSEIAVTYDVLIDLKTELPDGLTMKLDTQTADVVENNIYTFNNVGSFTPLDDSIHNHSLIFTATEDLVEDVNISDLEIKILLSQ